MLFFWAVVSFLVMHPDLQHAMNEVNHDFFRSGHMEDCWPFFQPNFTAANELRSQHSADEASLSLHFRGWVCLPYCLPLPPTY